MPIDSDTSEMLELLEKKMKEMHLDPTQKEMLKQALKQEKFSKIAQLVANQLRAKGKPDIADQLIDISPLFDPHNFWHNQPVPKMNEKVAESELDKPIEVRTLD